MIGILVVDNSSQTHWLNFTNVEHELQYEFDPANKVFGIITISCILIVNIPLLTYIFRNGEETFMNRLIALDCVICIRKVSRYFPNSFQSKTSDTKVK